MRYFKLYLFLMFSLVFLTMDVYIHAQQNRYALVIGISGYPNFEEDDKLEYSDDDAQAFASFIQTSSGGEFLKRNIKLIINENATRVGIAEGINWLKMRSSSDDLVYIFFAGHGLVDDVGHAYFMPYNGHQSAPSALGFRADRFLEDIRSQVNYKYLVLFTDACHAGSIYTRGTSRGSENIVSEVDRTWERLFKGQNEITMALLSAASNQRSYEDKALQHGLFTYYLIEGMKGLADGAHNGEKDNTVTAIELYHYLLNKVENHASQKGWKQTPTRSPTFVPDFPVALNFNKMVSNLGKPNFEVAYSYYNQGLKLFDKKQFQNAISKFKSAIEINPNYSYAYNAIGASYESLEQHIRAKEYYQLAIKYDSTNWLPYSNLAVLVYNQGDARVAERFLDKATRLNPNPDWDYIYHLKALLHHEFSPFNFEEAFENQQRAYELNPDSISTIYNLMVYSFTNQKNEYSLNLGKTLRDNLRLKYKDSEYFYYRDDFSERRYYFMSSLFTMLNYLILDDYNNFEKWYNFVINFYNSYPNFNTDWKNFSYTGTKHYVLNSSHLKASEKSLIVNIFDLLSGPKTQDRINEFNLRLPSQYSHLRKAKIPK